MLLFSGALMLPNSHLAYRTTWLRQERGRAMQALGIARVQPCVGWIALVAMTVAVSGICSDRPLVDLDAQALAAGPVKAWGLTARKRIRMPVAML